MGREAGNALEGPGLRTRGRRDPGPGRAAHPGDRAALRRRLRDVPEDRLERGPTYMAGPLTSCESMVWRGRDYLTTPQKIKVSADKLFTSGINHIFYHGYPLPRPGRRRRPLPVFRRLFLGPLRVLALLAVYERGQRVHLRLPGQGSGGAGRPQTLPCITRGSASPIFASSPATTTSSFSTASSEARASRARTR